MGPRAGLRRYPRYLVRPSFPPPPLSPFPFLPLLLAVETERACRYDNEYAIKQIETGHQALLARQPATDSAKPGPSLLGRTLPRVMYIPIPFSNPSKWETWN